MENIFRHLHDHGQQVTTHSIPWSFVGAMVAINFKVLADLESVFTRFRQFLIKKKRITNGPVMAGLSEQKSKLLWNNWRTPKYRR
jgi:hypothetical protein